MVAQPMGPLIASLHQDVVNCVGGMAVLLPLLEQVVSKKEEPEDEQETNDLVGPELTSSRNAQGLRIPLGKSSGEDLRGCGVGWLGVTTVVLGSSKGRRGLAWGTKSSGIMEKLFASFNIVMT